VVTDFSRFSVSFWVNGFRVANPYIMVAKATAMKQAIKMRIGAYLFVVVMVFGFLSGPPLEIRYVC
jgi:hypothetical protein